MEFHGGVEGVATALEASPEQVLRWSQGSDPIPATIFMKVVDLVIEHDLAELRRSVPSARTPAERGELLVAKSRMLRGTIRVRFRSSPRGNAFSGAAWRPIAHPFFEAGFAPKNKRELFAAALDAAMKVAGTDLGTIQLLAASGGLHIGAQCGFSKPFLDFFHVVWCGAGSACGVALGENRQVFVGDVERDPIFAGTVGGSVVLEAGVHAVATSPILDDAGIAVGMLSTHYRAPTTVEEANLPGQQHVAERVGCWLKAERPRPR